MISRFGEKILALIYNKNHSNAPKSKLCLTICMSYAFGFPMQTLKVLKMDKEQCVTVFGDACLIHT